MILPIEKVAVKWKFLTPYSWFWCQMLKKDTSVANHLKCLFFLAKLKIRLMVLIPSCLFHLQSIFNP